MNPAKVFLYAEFQASIPFEDIDWEPVNVQMKEFTDLKSKTWLSGLGNNSLGGFYEFDSVDNAQNYIDNLLIVSQSFIIFRYGLSFGCYCLL